jgi:hypothetical protein
VTERLTGGFGRKDMAIQDSSQRRWQDWANFALGLWLAVSPWLADYSGYPVATTNAVVAGLFLAVAAHIGFSCDHESCEWLNMGIGLWLLGAPFVLGFETHYVATANCIAVGAFTVVLSAWALQLDREVGKLWHRMIAGH